MKFIPSDIMGRVSMFSLDAHIDTLEKRLKEKEIKLLDLEYTWDQKTSSKLIDSFILGFPVPPIYIIKRKGNKHYDIIDGNHRVRTAVSFFENKLKLVLNNKDLNGKIYKDLNEDHKNILNTATLRIFGIREIDDDALVHEIFRRLNCGTTKRTSKEIKELLNAK